MPTSYTDQLKGIINDMASAIINSGQAFNSNGVVDVISNPQGGCNPSSGSGNICHYATNNPNMNTWIPNHLNIYRPDSQEENGPGTSWSFAQDSKIMYGWWNGTNLDGSDQIGYVLSQSMYEYLCIQYPKTIYGNE